MALPCCAVLFLVLAATTPCAADGGTTTGCYSIQVGAVPPAKHGTGLTTYRQLRQQGHHSYIYGVKIGGKKWYRIAIGLFDSRAAAAEFGTDFTASTGMEQFVAKAPVRVLPGPDGRAFIVGKSTLWVRDNGENREIFAFDAKPQKRRRLPAPIIAVPSPDGRALVIQYNDALYLADMDRPNALSLMDRRMPGLYRPQPRWSPSAKYVAFLDMLEFEVPTGLWTARADGSGLRCLACNRTGRSAVRWFVWHPTEDRVLFIEAFSHGTVAVGGDLISADMDGTVRPITAIKRGEREEIAGDLTIADGYLNFRRVHFDENFNEKTFTADRIPLDVLQTRQ
jgi:hypothetical protein